MKRLVIIICLFLGIIENKVFSANIVVNQGMSFGRVQYNLVPAYYKIGKNNILQSTNTSNTANQGSRLAIITIYGEPNDEVELSFTPTNLNGNTGSIIVQDIEVIDNNHIIKLDNIGQAVVHISGSLSITDNLLQGVFNSSVTVWAKYKNQKLNLSQSIPVYLDLYSVRQLRNTVISQLSFGIIYVLPTTSCSITVNLDNTRIHNCPGVDGRVSINEFTYDNLLAILPIKLSTLPTQVILKGPSGVTLMVNNLKSSIDATNLFSQRVKIGATLTIPTNSKPGIYMGTYQITIIL